MKKIIILTDYKGNFGSKWDAVPYNSGFDKELLVKYFVEKNYQVEYAELSKANEINNIKGIPVLYTSSEDIGYRYKDFIEDIIYFLELKGANIIPSYKFLRANNNKVFMELLRKKLGDQWGDKLKLWVFGTLEEMEKIINEFNFPIVVKTAAGAMSRGVSLASNKKEFLKKAKIIGRTVNFKQDLKDYLRAYLHKGYIKESLYRNKFIVQQFIPSLKSDYKVLIFGERYYIFERPVSKNDFRASGSGNANYIYGSNVSCPNGIFDYAKHVFEQANVPHLSIDIAFDGKQFYLLEFQAVYFGTVGHVKSDGFYVNNEGIWEFQNQIIDIEKVYAESIDTFLKIQRPVDK